METQKTILIVDDEINVLYALKRNLARLGNFNVVLCTTPLEALKLAAAQHIDLFIVDYHMPRIHGDEFLVFARQLHPQAGRILLSGAVDMQGLANAINRARIHRFLAKPVQWHELHSQIQEILDQQQSTDTLSQVA